MQRTGLLSCLLALTALLGVASAQDPAAVLDGPVAESEAATSEPAADDAATTDESPAEAMEEPAATEPEAPAPTEAEEPAAEDAEETPVAEDADSADESEDGDEADEEEATEDEGAPAATDLGGLISRAPQFFALTHHAAVHLPIALWLFGAFFVLVGAVIPSWRNQIPVACLIGGALTSVAAVASGWWYAAYEYGEPWAWGDGFGDWSEHLVKHRWTGFGLALGSVVLSIIALISQARKSKRLGVLWRLGLIALALAVAWEGHIGGELIHGEGFLEEAFQEWVHPEAE